MNLRDYATIAKYYDPLYSSMERKDLPFYLEMAQRYGGPILEMGCGTGRIFLEIAKRDFRIHGLDYSKEMLTKLEEKLEMLSPSQKKKVVLHQQDMRAFSLGKRYKLILIPFRAMQHMYSIEDQVAVLKRAKAHLYPGGFLIFDVFYPNFELLAKDMAEEVMDTEWTENSTPERTFRRYFIRNKVHKLLQYFEGEFIFRTYENDEQTAEERTSFKMSYYTYPHLLLLFKHCGLKILEEYGSFSRDSIEIGEEMIFVLSRNK